MTASTPRTFPTGTILGYPRIGRRRELKRAVEAFWKHDIGVAELEETAAGLRAATRERLASLGLGTTDSSIPESFSYYDQVLDAAVTVGAIPERFADLVDDDGTLDLAGYFTIARGEGDKAPLEMTKWFDSNYHYLVPEIGPDTAFHLASDRLVREVAEAKAAGYTTRPVIVGPVTLLLLSKAADGAPAGFAAARASSTTCCPSTPSCSRGWPRPAPSGCSSTSRRWSASRSRPRAARCSRAVQAAYEALGADRPLGILVAAPYGALDDALPVLESAPIDAIALDLVRGCRARRPGDRQGARRRRHRRPQHLARRPRGRLRKARGAAGRLAERRRWRPRPTCSTRRTTSRTSPTCPAS